MLALAPLASMDGYVTDGVLYPRPALWSISYQLLGILQVSPVYYLVGIFSGLHLSRPARRIPVEIARAVLPAVLLGHSIPSIFFFLPVTDINLRQTFIALWQPYPLYCSLLTAGIAAAIRHVTAPAKQALVADEKAKDKSPRPKKDLDTYEDSDLAPLREAYTSAFALMALAHITVVSFIACRSDLTFADVFGNLPNVFAGDLEPLEATQAIFAFIKCDLLVFIIAQFVYCVYVVVELRGKCLVYDPLSY